MIDPQRPTSVPPSDASWSCARRLAAVLVGRRPLAGCATLTGEPRRRRDRRAQAPAQRRTPQRHRRRDRGGPAARRAEPRPKPRCGRPRKSSTRRRRDDSLRGDAPVRPPPARWTRPSSRSRRRPRRPRCRERCHGAPVPGAIQSEPASPPRRPAQARAEDPQVLDDRGYTLFHQKSYDLAEASFRTFLARFPTSDLADNALFWIGESHYAKGDYPAALAAFAETVARFPQGNKVSDALLKAGRCLEQLGRHRRGHQHLPRGGAALSGLGRGGRRQGTAGRARRPTRQRPGQTWLTRDKESPSRLDSECGEV